MNPEYNREDLERIIRETFDSVSKDSQERRSVFYFFGTAEQYSFINEVFKEEVIKQLKDNES